MLQSPYKHVFTASGLALAGAIGLAFRQIDQVFWFSWGLYVGSMIYQFAAMRWCDAWERETFKRLMAELDDIIEKKKAENAKP